MKLLHIDSSVLGANSVSRLITAAAVERLRQDDANFEIVYSRVIVRRDR
jgi:FMN-dependent NADH-azoreductase